MGGYDVQTGRSLCPVQVPADKVTALEVKKKVASQTVIRSSKELDFSDTLLANVIESLPT